MNNEVYQKVTIVKERIKKAYLINNRDPWIIGYSGGKDSTFLTQLVFEVLNELVSDGVELHRNVYICSSNTLIENPIVAAHQHKNIKLMNEVGKRLMIQADLVIPKIDETFWVQLIGKGYPAPNQHFRWCTSRLKINPIADYSKKLLKETGRVVILIGSRSGESASRDRIINSRVDVNHYSQHSTLQYATQFSPILELTIKDIWTYLLTSKSPWGADLANKELFSLYEQSSTDQECAWTAELNTTAKGCGNSRWGCWACTVISQDKSLSTFVSNGYENLQEMQFFTDKIRGERSLRETRYLGGIQYLRNGDLLPKKHRLKLKQSSDGKYLELSKQGYRMPIKIDMNTFIDQYSKIQYTLIDKQVFDNIAISKFFTDELYNTIVKISGEYYLMGMGPYTLSYREKLLNEVERLQQIYRQEDIQIITEEEISLIKEHWARLKDCLEEIKNG